MHVCVCVRVCVCPTPPRPALSDLVGEMGLATERGHGVELRGHGEPPGQAQYGRHPCDGLNMQGRRVIQ